MVILRNDGNGNFSLVDPDTIGIIHRAYSGITTGAIDNDGDLDMVVVGLDGDGDTIGHLYRNAGAGTFSFLRSFNGIDGYMGAFADLDHDGDIDVGDDFLDRSLDGQSGPLMTGFRRHEPRMLREHQIFRLRPTVVR